MKCHTTYGKYHRIIADIVDKLYTSVTVYVNTMSPYSTVITEFHNTVIRFYNNYGTCQLNTTI